MILFKEMIDLVTIESVAKKYPSFIRINDNPDHIAVQFGDVNETNECQTNLMMNHHIYGSIEADASDSNPHTKGPSNYFLIIYKEEV